MSNLTDTHDRTKRMVSLSFLASFIVILQFASYFIKIGTFSVSLVLVPITVGAVVYGPVAGAFLGGVFGAVCIIAGLIGLDAGTLILLGINPYYTVFLALIKGIAAGFISGLSFKVFYRLFHGMLYPSAVIPTILTPIVNTSLFLSLMLVFFRDTLYEWGGNSDSLLIIFSTVVGTNFIFEFILNLILCPLIASVLIKNGKLRQFR